MGKISGLPDLERLEIIGYLAQEGVIDKITAEVPLRKCAEFENKYGVKPYPINSNKKFSEQLRIYLSDPESAPPLLKALESLLKTMVFLSLASRTASRFCNMQKDSAQMHMKLS